MIFNTESKKGQVGGMRAHCTCWSEVKRTIVAQIGGEQEVSKKGQKCDPLGAFSAHFEGLSEKCTMCGACGCEKGSGRRGRLRYNGPKWGCFGKPFKRPRKMSLGGITPQFQATEARKCLLKAGKSRGTILVAIEVRVQGGATLFWGPNAGKRAQNRAVLALFWPKLVAGVKWTRGVENAI